MLWLIILGAYCALVVVSCWLLLLEARKASLIDARVDEPCE